MYNLLILSIFIIIVIYIIFNNNITYNCKITETVIKLLILILFLHLIYYINYNNIEPLTNGAIAANTLELGNFKYVPNDDYNIFTHGYLEFSMPYRNKQEIRKCRIGPAYDPKDLKDGALPLIYVDYK